MRYLFIGAHPDDIELSCGGWIAKLNQDDSNEIMYLCFCDCLIEHEMEKSCETMGVFDYANLEYKVRFLHEERKHVLDWMIDRKIQFKPDIVVTHSIGDVHQDHKVVGEESLRAFKDYNLITYLSPWNGIQQSNYFVEISEDNVESKLKALDCYESQKHRMYMNPEFTKAQLIYNGVMCGKKYAEAFQVIRMIS